MVSLILAGRLIEGWMIWTYVFGKGVEQAVKFGVAYRGCFDGKVCEVVMFYWRVHAYGEDGAMGAVG